MCQPRVSHVQQKSDTHVHICICVCICVRKPSCQPICLPALLCPTPYLSAGQPSSPLTKCLTTRGMPAMASSALSQNGRAQSPDPAVAGQDALTHCDTAAKLLVSGGLFLPRMLLPNCQPARSCRARSECARPRTMGLQTRSPTATWAVSSLLAAAARTSATASATICETCACACGSLYPLSLLAQFCFRGRCVGHLCL